MADLDFTLRHVEERDPDTIDLRPRQPMLNLAKAQAFADFLRSEVEAGRDLTIRIESQGIPSITVISVNDRPQKCTRIQWECDPTSGRNWVHLEIGGVWFRGVLRESFTLAGSWLVQLREIGASRG